MKITKVLFYALGLGLTVFAANNAAAVSILSEDILTLSGTYHTQGGQIPIEIGSGFFRGS